MSLNKLFSNFNFGGVIMIVLFAGMAYGIASWFITNNTIAYSTPPEYVSINVIDESTGKYVTKYLPVKKQFPIDSVKQKFNVGTVLHSGNKSNVLLFHQNPTFLVWIFLICAMISIAAGSVPVFVRQGLELKNKFNISSGHIWWARIYAGLVFVFLVFSNARLPGYYDPPAMFSDLKILFKNPHMPELIVGATILLIAPALMLIFLIGVSSDKILAHARQLNDDADKTLTPKDIEDAAKKLKLLHGTLQSVLQVLAIIVVFSVLTSSALGQSIHATIEIEGFDLYPPEVSLVYGMYFSLFLCILYLPVYYYVKQNYLRLKEYAIDIMPSDDVKEKSWYKDLIGDSRFDGTALENVRMALTMLAPLLTGFIPETLHMIK